MDHKLKIAIIGAGPAGLFSGLLLAAQNHEVSIFEKNDRIKRKLCGEYLCPKGVELLEKHQLLKMMNQKFLPLNGMIITSPSNITVKCHFPFRKKNWYGLALNREEFDQSLLDLAKANGSQVFFNSLIKDISFNKNSWNLDINGETKSFDLVIAADGRVSGVAKLFGHNDKLDTSRVAIHFYLPRINYLGSRFGEMHIFDDGTYCGLDPINDHEVNVSFVIDAAKIRGENLLQLARDYFKKSTRLSSMFNEIPDDIAIKTVSPLTNKNYFVAGNQLAYVGDASGFIDPLTGEGIYNAILSADLLSTAILQNQNITKALSQYKSQKKRIQFQKKILNHFFQFVIKKPKLSHLIAKFIESNQLRADYFIGIIGNIYSPLRGILKMLLA